MVIIFSIDKFIEGWLESKEEEPLINYHEFDALCDLYKSLNQDFCFLITNYDYELINELTEKITGHAFDRDGNGYYSSVLYNAEKPSISNVLDFLGCHGSNLDPDMPMIDLYSDRWDYLFITDDEKDTEMGERLNIRTILLATSIIEYPRKSLTIEEIYNYIHLTKIINNSKKLWDSSIKNYDHYK